MRAGGALSPSCLLLVLTETLLAARWLLEPLAHSIMPRTQSAQQLQRGSGSPATRRNDLPSGLLARPAAIGPPTTPPKHELCRGKLREGRRADDAHSALRLPSSFLLAVVGLSSSILDFLRHTAAPPSSVGAHS